MKNINPNEMIDWFESKAAEFKRIAATLRETFNSSGHPTIQVGPPLPFAPLPLEMVRATLQTLGTARHSDIAEALKAKPEDVRNVLMDNKNTFEMTGRGWWSVRK